MSVLNANGLFQTNARGTVGASANPEDRPQSEIWLNVGVMVKTVNPDTGEEENELLTLPVNLPIDTMKKRDIPTRKPTTVKGKQFRDRAVASNQLLDFIQKAAANLEPGASMTLEGFTLQLQRVNEKEDESAGTNPADNPYLSQIGATFGIKQ